MDQLPAALVRRLAISPSRIRLASVDELRNGIHSKLLLFVSTIWSGSSLRAFEALNQALAARPEFESLSLVVINNDELGLHIYLSANGIQPNGDGETIWIDGGKIVKWTAKYTLEAQSELNSFLSEICESPYVR